MSYQIADAVSYCEIDGQLVFLDLEADRYFRLSTALEDAFRRFVQTGDTESDARADLAKHRILIDAPDGEPPVPSPTVATPERSALERLPSSKGSALIALPEVAATVAWIQRQLRMQRVPLALLVRNAAVYRERKALCATGAIDEARLLRAVDQFNRARLLVPIEPRCLLDSMSLVRFLARRGLYAQLIFGVSIDPFAAHCWLQRRDLVLNDSVGNVAAHTPIRTV